MSGFAYCSVKFWFFDVNILSYYYIFLPNNPTIIIALITLVVLCIIIKFFLIINASKIIAFITLIA